MFKIGLSREINKDSFNCNLNALLSFKCIAKLSKLVYACRIQVWFNLHFTSSLIFHLLFIWKTSRRNSVFKGHFSNLFNVFPQLFIDKCIKEYLSKLLVPKTIIHTVDKKTCPVSFTFFRFFIIWDEAPFTNIFENYIPYCSLKVVYHSRSRIFNLFNFKDIVNTNLS